MLISFHGDHSWSYLILQYCDYVPICIFPLLKPHTVFHCHEKSDRMLCSVSDCKRCFNCKELDVISKVSDEHLSYYYYYYHGKCTVCPRGVWLCSYHVLAWNCFIKNWNVPKTGQSFPWFVPSTGERLRENRFNFCLYSQPLPCSYTCWITWLELIRDSVVFINLD